MQPGEVQCSYDDAAQYGNRQVGNNGITVTAMITNASSQGTLPSTRSDPHAKVCCATTNNTPTSAAIEVLDLAAT